MRMSTPSLSVGAKPLGDPYAAVARLYGTCLDPVITRWQKKALNLRPPRTGTVALDVGCGTGAQLNLYRSYGCRVFGIERSAGMIAAARQNIQDPLNLCRADAAGMPYRDQTFDRMLLSMMLHEIPPDTRSAVMAESLRVLKDGGRMLIIDYRIDRPDPPLGRLLKGIITLIEMAAGRSHFRNYLNFLASGGLAPLLKNHRLSVENHDSAALGNIGLYIVRKDLGRDKHFET